MSYPLPRGITEETLVRDFTDGCIISIEESIKDEWPVIAIATMHYRSEGNIRDLMDAMGWEFPVPEEELKSFGIRCTTGYVPKGAFHTPEEAEIWGRTFLSRADRKTCCVRPFTEWFRSITMVKERIPLWP